MAPLPGTVGTEQETVGSAGEVMEDFSEEASQIQALQKDFSQLGAAGVPGRRTCVSKSWEPHERGPPQQSVTSMH